MVIILVREETFLSFEDYFWGNVDLNNKVILDAGTGFGVTTLGIAKRINLQKARSRIISVDINPQSFEFARKLLMEHGLLDLVTFEKADLSSMPKIQNESVNIVISTRTLSDINSFSCRLVRAIAEFYRVLRKGGRVILSDAYPRSKALSEEEKVAVRRWQLAKAISHIIGRPHSHEVEPEDLEFIMTLVGFQKCRWAVFKGDEISRQRINHFVTSATEMTAQIENPELRKAFIEEIKAIRETFNEIGGIFPPRYIIHAVK